MVRELALSSNRCILALAGLGVSKRAAGWRASAPQNSPQLAASRPQLSHTPQQLCPSSSGHSPPFLAYTTSWTHHLHLYHAHRVNIHFTRHFVDAPHRCACPGKETRNKCAHLKKSDRIHSSDDPVTSPYKLSHCTTITRPELRQLLRMIARRSTTNCIND